MQNHFVILIVLPVHVMLNKFRVEDISKSLIIMNPNDETIREQFINTKINLYNHLIN